ncbi:hypothetical protein [Amycolatopsis thailandensis]|uniref:hypothetical protein n=1 Tax=Amycolatopsis thailandensis TaxID=589330 RepID=UPI0036285C7A
MLSNKIHVAADGRIRRGSGSSRAKPETTRCWLGITVARIARCAAKGHKRRKSRSGGRPPMFDAEVHKQRNVVEPVHQDRFEGRARSTTTHPAPACR